MRAVRECRCDVIHRREAHLLVGEEERIVLRMGVGAPDNPVPDQRIREARNGEIGVAGGHDSSQEGCNLGRTGSVLVLVLL